MIRGKSFGTWRLAASMIDDFTLPTSVMIAEVLAELPISISSYSMASTGTAMTTRSESRTASATELAASSMTPSERPWANSSGARSNAVTTDAIFRALIAAAIEPPIKPRPIMATRSNLGPICSDTGSAGTQDKLQRLNKSHIFCRQADGDSQMIRHFIHADGPDDNAMMQQGFVNGHGGLTQIDRQKITD